MNIDQVRTAIQEMLTDESVPAAGGITAEVRPAYDSLLGMGEEVIPEIVQALIQCAQGRGRGMWWYGGEVLCDLLSEIKSKGASSALMDVLKTDSKIVEYDRIRYRAAKMLGSFDDPSLVPELTSVIRLPHAPVSEINKTIERLGGTKMVTPETIILDGKKIKDDNDALKYFASHRDKVGEWESRELQGGFFWWYGNRFEKVHGLEAALPCYAASVMADPGPSSPAWEKFGNVRPSQEEAAKLGTKYPLPGAPTAGASKLRKCPKCGEESADTFDSCWNCGTVFSTGLPPSGQPGGESRDGSPPDSEIPGSYAARFKEWEETVARINRNWVIACFVLLGINLILFAVFRAVSLGGLLLIGIMYFVNLGSTRRAKELYNELGLSPGLIKAIRSGEVKAADASQWSTATQQAATHGGKSGPIKVVPGWCMPLFLLITLNIYVPFWLYRVFRELHSRRATDLSPGKAVGYMFIPFFNFVWVFIAFNKLGDAIRSAYTHAGLTPPGTGIVWLPPITLLLGIALNLAVPLLGVAVAIVLLSIALCVIQGYMNRLAVAQAR
jgi:hypothetical protein